jgi:UrcA family protein
MKMMATLKLSLSVVAAAAAMFAVPAMAGVKTVEVETGDLDLSREAGQQELQDRIERAVRRVCDSTAVRPLSERQAIAKCEKNARADAQVQAEQLIAENGQLRNQLARARRVATDK